MSYVNQVTELINPCVIHMGNNYWYDMTIIAQAIVNDHYLYPSHYMTDTV